jgi:hypothetical protein
MRGETARAALAILALTLLICLPSLFGRELWNPDEPRYAEVTREMLALKDPLVPYLNDAPYPEKPPLYFWLSAGLQALGFGLRAGRWVSAFATLGTLYLTWLLGRLWLGNRTGLLAAFVLATSALYAWVARCGVLDPTLTALTTLAIYGFARHRKDGGPWIALFWVGMGLATLTKGPVGIAIPVLAVMAFGPAELRLRLRERHVLWGLPLTALTIGIWLVPAVASGGPEYAQTLLLKQTFGRMVDSFSHPRPWHYHLVRLPLHFFPWSLLLLPALYRAWRAKDDDETPARALAIWIVLGVLLFSLISGKRDRYLLPFYPGLALVVAFFIDRAWLRARSVESRRWVAATVGLPLWIFAAIGASVLLLLVAGPRLAFDAASESARVRDLLQDLATPPLASLLAAVATLLVAFAAFGLLAAARRRSLASISCLVAPVLTLSLTWDLLVAPRVDPLKSHRAAAARVTELADAGFGVALYRSEYSGVFNLYAERAYIRVLGIPAKVERFLRRSEPVLVITTRERYERDLAGTRAGVGALPLGDVGHRSYVALINDPGAHLLAARDEPAAPRTAGP